MKVDGNELRNLLMGQSQKARRDYKRASIIIFFTVLLGLGWLGFSAYSAARLQRQSANLSTQVKSQTAELGRLQEDIKKTTQELDVKTRKLEAIGSIASNPQMEPQKALEQIAGVTRGPTGPIAKQEPSPNTTPSASPTPTSSTSLVGTTWNYQNGNVHYVIRFLPDNQFRYKPAGGGEQYGRWSQKGDTVRIITSNGAEKETGTIRGSRIDGTGKPDIGAEYKWTATKIN